MQVLERLIKGKELSYSMKEAHTTCINYWINKRIIVYSVFVIFLKKG
ncbi:hypothetical protein BTH160X_150047 [Brochothrix thermosphacta]|nr:hypothetical protein BTH160X_150047 [Brochothrix thermosphacta]